MANGGLDVPLHYQIITAHVHLLLVGFILMMIMGVALWMFPRLPKGDEGYSPDLSKSLVKNP